MSNAAPILNRLPFAQMGTVEYALLHLRCSADLVRDVLAHPEQYYTAASVPRRRRSKLPRTVFTVAKNLQRVHRTIALGLQEHVAAMPATVHGFRKGHSIVSNAKVHCHGAKQVAVADVHDFFGNVRLPDVVNVFARLGCPHQVALLLARLCVHQDSLPQGGRASPSLANLAAGPLDEAILTAFPRVSYTRYADDMAFSGARVPSEPKLEAVLKAHGFKLRPGSYRVQRRGAGQFVTGLNVESDNPRVPRRIRRRIGRDLYYIGTRGIDDHLQRLRGVRPSPSEAEKYLQRLRGWIASYGSIEKELGKAWGKEFNLLRMPGIAPLPE